MRLSKFLADFVYQQPVRDKQKSSIVKSRNELQYSKQNASLSISMYEALGFERHGRRTVCLSVCLSRASELFVVLTAVTPSLARSLCSNPISGEIAKVGIDESISLGGNRRFPFGRMVPLSGRREVGIPRHSTSFAGCSSPSLPARGKITGRR